ncbi:MAG: HIT domain-containing protein [Spirochaetes bacterium]|nr:HIT domain-containing protein [Spirochaetota bacterium]
MRNYLFNTEKIKYVLSEKSGSHCIFCSIRDGEEDVKNLNLFQTDLSLITLNLYPLNPGHLMILPLRHITCYEELSDAEAADIFKCTRLSIRILNSEFQPHGYNIGYNLGEGSGASIGHIHQHIVPRYRNEAGFLEVLGGTKISLVDPVDAFERIAGKFKEAAER